LAWPFYSFRRHPEILVTFLIGVVLILAGGICVLLQWPYRAAVLSGIGGSLAAAALVSSFASIDDESYTEFRALGIRKSYFHRTRIEESKWCKWLREAKRHCTLLGIAHHKWCADGSFPNALRESLNRGVEVKFFFLDPGSEAAKLRVREDVRAARNTIQEIQESIRFIWNIREQLAPPAKQHLKLYVYNATPSSGTQWFDDFMVVTHYLAGFPNVTSPALVVERVTTEPGEPSLYEIYEENLKKVEQSYSKVIDENWIRIHLPMEGGDADDRV
jgi:Domain of unknown function (DUF5919)